MNSQFVIGCIFEPAIREGSWICKRPSDQGPWVFVQLSEEPLGYRRYVIEITGVSRNGNSRQGKVVAIIGDLLKELTTALKGATWYRDRHGAPWVYGLKTDHGEFNAYLQDVINNSGHWSTRVVFEPGKSSSFRVLKNELANWLVINDKVECERAYAAPFAPGVTPAVGKGQMVAMMLARRSAS